MNKNPRRPKQMDKIISKILNSEYREKSEDRGNNLIKELTERGIFN